jgi:palmitoyltransferase
LCVLICAQTATARADAADKPFLLFISYGTILAIYICLESAYQVYMFMTDDGAYDMPSPDLPSDGSPPTHTVVSTHRLTDGQADHQQEVEFSPLVYMLLAMIGAFFTLAIGGLATYHWYLVW